MFVFLFLKICYKVTQKKEHLEAWDNLRLNNRHLSPTFQAKKKETKNCNVNSAYIVYTRTNIITIQALLWKIYYTHRCIMTKIAIRKQTFISNLKTIFAVMID